jgi:hypothetical protein
MHTLAGHLDERLVHAPSETLALVDLESYPSFLGKEADYFDMMAHLSSQMQALTAMSWKAPDGMLKLRVVLSKQEDLTAPAWSGRVTIASGNLRTSGRLCLTTHERLFDSARHRHRSLAGVAPVTKASPSQLVCLPPGIYSITAYYRSGHPRRGASDLATEADYTVFLRHYPFPPPRFAPIRLSSEILSHGRGELGETPPGVITSHARIW